MRIEVFFVKKPRSFASLSFLKNQAGLKLRLAQVHTSEPDTDVNFELVKLIRELAQNGKREEAKANFDTAPEKSTLLYNIMISAADRCRRYEKGLQLFEEMRTVGMKLSVVTYGSALTILGRLGRYADARALWQEMCDQKLIPSPACFTGLLNSAAVAGDMEAIDALIAEAAAEGRELNHHQWGCVLRACRQVGDINRVLCTLRDMELRGVPRSVVHYTLALAACSRGAISGSDASATEASVVRVVDQMTQDNISADCYFIEEHVRAVLGGRDLRAMRQWTIQRVQMLPVATRARAMEVIMQSRAQGIHQTPLLLEVASRLQEASATDASNAHASISVRMTGGALPDGWSSAHDPASGRLYYWMLSDPLNTTTWQLPDLP